MKKKHLTNMKKTLSVFLTVLMIMTCWVFVPGEHNHASAIATDTTYAKADKYGTPANNVSNTRFVHFGKNGTYDRTNNKTNELYLYYPSAIYLDKSETLQSAGYKIDVEYHIGTNSAYKVLLGGALWGDYRDTGVSSTSYPNYFTMTNIFSDYTIDASIPDGGNSDSVAIDKRDSGDSFAPGNARHQSYVKFAATSSGAPNNATIYLMGTPNSSYVGKTSIFSTSGTSIDFYGMGHNGSNGTDKGITAMFQGKWDDGYMPDGQWPEMVWDITIYDKSTLGAAVTKANNIFTGSSSYSGLATSSSAWSTFTGQRSSGSAALTKRDTNQTNIDNAKNSLESAINALSFKADNTTLKNVVLDAEARVNKPGFETLYTEASVKALKNALESAKSSSLYTSANTYAAKDYADAGKKANDDQATINNLTNGINTAVYGLVRKYDVGFDNLFSLADWAASNAVNVPRGSATCDVTAGTITTTSWDEATGKAWINGASGRKEAEAQDCYTSYGLSSSYSTMKVEDDTAYTLTFDATDNGQCYVFFYTDSGSCTTAHQNLGASAGSNVKTFTTPSDCTGIQVRFGSTGAYSKTITFSKIGVFKAEDYDSYAKDYSRIRQVFTVGDTDELSLKPSREGWTFDGWVDENNNPVTSVAGLNRSDTVYATWTKLWTVTFRKADGSVLVKRTVKDGENAEEPSAPTKASDDNGKYTFTGWDVPFTNVKSDITVTPKFDTTPHSNFKYSLVAPATCTENATVTKKCGVCDYSYGEGLYDGTENEAWIADGHDFTGTIKANSYIGDANNQKDTDTHQRKCKNCSATTEETHEKTWYSIKTEGATCSTPGTVYWECDCGAKKTTQGEKAPNVHVNTKKINAIEATCTVDGKYADTYCEDCDTIISTGAVIPHSGHSFTVYTSNGDATCTADGTKKSKCDNCDAIDTQPDAGSATGHTWLNEGTVLATKADCETDATYYQTCANCDISAKDDTTHTGSTWTDVGSATGHDYTGTDIRDNENGTHSYSCVNGCGTYGYNKVKDAGKYCTYGEWSKTEETTHTKTCSECNYKVTEEHKWSAWTSTEPNKEANGAQTRNCSDCGRVETISCVYETTHKDATCTAPEITTYKCKDCGHGYTVTGKAATGHYYTDTADVKSNSGSHSYGCTECDTYGYDGIQNAAEPCDYGYTKTTDGQHKATCKVCNYSFTENCVAAEGKEATCSARAVCGKCDKEFGSYAAHNFTADGGIVALGNGQHAYRCENCKDKDKYGIDANENESVACSGGKATCSAPANCEVCSQAYGNVNANAHVWGEWKNVEDTKTHERVCKLDNTHTQIQDCLCTSPTATPPDCNTPSYTINTCDDCNHTWQTENNDALGHDWTGAWVANEDGTHTKTCARNCKYDDNTLTEDCADAEPFVKEATCTEDGYTAHTCDGCGYEWETDAVPATGHSYKDKRQLATDTYKRSDKSCTTDLTYWYVCDNCDASAEVDKDNEKFVLTDLYWMPEGGEQTGHSFDEECGEYPVSSATCTTKATYYYSCSNAGCDEKGTGTYEAGDVLGHDWVHPAEDKLADYNVVKADCVTDATYYYVCNRDGCGISSQGVKTDGETWTDEGSATGHDFDHNNNGELKDEGDTGYTAYKAADCFEAGSLEHWTCETCGKKYADKDNNSSELSNTVLIKRNHALKTVYGKDATCEESGYTKHQACDYDDCDYKSEAYEVIPAKGHDFLATNGYYTDAENGYHAYYCTDCDAYGVNAVKYEVAEGVVKGGIKCTFSGEYVNYDANGVHYHKQLCVCGNAESEACTAAETEKVDATCTEDGYYKYTCACGFEWTEASEDEADKAQGHSLKVKANGNGTHTEYCEKCDYKKTAEKCTPKAPGAACGEKEICAVCETEYGKPVAHSFTHYVHDANSEKCQIDGTKTAKCDNCDATDTVTDVGSALEHKMTADWTYDLSGWTNMPEDFDEDAITEPTCHTAGKQIKYCTNEGCAHYVTQTVKADETLHQWKVDAEGKEVWDIVSGDCGTGVTLQNVCTVAGCGEARTRTEEAGHTWETICYIAPTCSMNGYKEFRCTVCGEYDREDLEKTEAHSYVFVSETPATCASNAYITEKCTICNGYLITETEGTVLEHKLVDCKGKAASCEIAGYTDYQKCSDCGAVVGKTEIPAAGHGKIDENGKCKDCGRVIYDSESGASCGCICHKESGLMKLIYKILNFFWKLFKISKSCECGNVHW